ncbi:MAG: HAMP domain-containing histidine kinase [Actinomycetota bacterium]|nr:HAMP domain-containing histidine kinase [Actinomycetota bacterium]
MSGLRALRGGLALALALAGLAAAVVYMSYDAAGAVTTVAILAALGLATVLATQVLVVRRERLGGLRRQAALLGALVAGQLAVGVGVFVALMFLSTHDAVLTVLVAAYTSALGLWAAQRLGREALADVDAIRGTLGAVGQGRRDVSTEVTGDNEIAQLAGEVDAMVTLLDKEERARQTLIAGVSHDLRTPITALRLLAEAIDDDIADTATRRQYAARMTTHVRALGALIDDLLELTRLQGGDLHWTLEQIDVEDLVAETVAAMQPAAEARMVVVNALRDHTMPQALAPPEKVQRVLFNLIQNAIRHTPPDGSVTVRAERIGGSVEVEVADTGRGIPEAQREQVFEPFFRGDSSRTEGGAGLGLAISRAIVEALGGRIWFEPTDVGARVRFRLPAAA